MTTTARRRLSADHGCGLTDTRTKVGSKLIDEAAPAVEGVMDGGIYCLTAEITVTDPNLKSVTLNGPARGAGGR